MGVNGKGDRVINSIYSDDPRAALMPCWPRGGIVRSLNRCLDRVLSMMRLGSTGLLASTQRSSSAASTFARALSGGKATPRCKANADKALARPATAFVVNCLVVASTGVRFCVERTTRAVGLYTWCQSRRQTAARQKRIEAEETRCSSLHLRLDRQPREGCCIPRGGHILRLCCHINRLS